MSVEDVRWVVTVPAIWRQQAKQFMREAAYQVWRREGSKAFNRISIIQGMKGFLDYPYISTL